jgi:hypothetical protein
MALAVPLLAVAVLTAAALAVYERYAGEHPLLDLLYEWRLRRRSLSDLARHAAARPRSDVVVTLTTLPSRISRIEPTIKSLLNQRVMPAAIRLYVPATSRREGADYRMPAWLERLSAVTIVRCEDLGPATKVVPALMSGRADERFLVVDDDRIYQPWLVEQMTRLSDANPDVAIAASGWDAPADLVDRPSRLMATFAGRPPVPLKCTRVGARRDVDIMQGFAGYLVKPRFFDVAALRDYSQAPPAAFFVDDVWVSAHCRVPKAVIGGRRTNFPSPIDARFFKRSSVALVNRGDGTPASRNNTILLQFFADRWRVSRRGARSETAAETRRRERV